MTIFIRCVYRVAELWEGFSGYLANHESTFMIFEGPMIIIAVAAMTIYHPGRVFDNLWAAAGRGDRGITMGKEFSSPSTEDLTNGDQWDAHHSTYHRV